MDRLRHLAIRSGLVAAGLAFAAYPALRPWGPETGVAGAGTFASGAWPAAHALGMLGFVLLALSLRGAATAVPWSWSGRPLREAETRAWLAVAFLLPYYGSEAYGLHALGQYASAHHDAGVLAVADGFRYAPLPMTTFAVGLLFLMLVGGRLALGLWHAGRLNRVGGLLAGLGLMTYLPQFYGSPELRIAHGVVLGLGLVLMAVGAGFPRFVDGSHEAFRRSSVHNPALQGGVVADAHQRLAEVAPGQ